ncbi:MAG: nickel-dependent hydrogenase large subunit [Candidatus Aenigmatarchaeota archaeon]
MSTRIEPLTRVEGEGEIVLYVDDHGVTRNVELRIVEAPRFFEHIVKGLHYTMIPDIVSRICGFCGVSYILTAVKAFENCMSINVSEKVETYRELVHLAERIKSHVLHIALLNLPDLLGLKNILELESRNPRILENVFKVLSLVDRLMKLTGGRFHNVVNIRVGGVFRLPESTTIKRIEETVTKELLPLFTELAEFVLGLETMPRIKHSVKYCTIAGEKYPGSGTALYFNGSRYSADLFYEKLVDVQQKPGKNNLVYRFKGEGYVVGPIARFNNYRGQLLSETRSLLEKYGWYKELENVYQSIVARTAEVYDALHRIPLMLDQIRGITETPAVLTGRVEPGHCFYATEAPRGILYQRFTLNEKGHVVGANIVTPTAQNIALAEDLAKREACGLKAEESIGVVQRVVVSFDPCISCSVHQLKISIVRSH